MNKLLSMLPFAVSQFIIRTFGKRVQIFCGEDGFVWFRQLGSWIANDDNHGSEPEQIGYAETIISLWED